MKLIIKAISIIALLLTPALTSASTPEVGRHINGGTFIHREPIEMHWNDWIAYPLMDENRYRQSNQAHLTLSSEGKGSEFVGNISIDCEDGSFSWNSASNFGEVLPTLEEINRVVPTRVVAVSIDLFCS